VNTAAVAFREGPWGALSPTRRGRLLMKWGEIIAEHADRIATIETGQNGKLFAEMRAQARIAQAWLYYFGGLADKIEGTVIPLDRQSIFNYTLREPLAWSASSRAELPTHRDHVAAPALAAGNTIVLKPSEITPRRSNWRGWPKRPMPPGVNVVTGFRETGEALVDHPRVAKVSFTGRWAPVARSPRARVGVSQSACSSSAARARTSCSVTPTRSGRRASRGHLRPPARRRAGSRTSSAHLRSVRDHW
jgi:aldehyde dehydrogenase (NAD+)